MPGLKEKVGIAGASSMLGKELAEELNESAFADASVSLLDEGDVAGQLETVAEEMTFLQKIEPASFEGMDFAFFAGSIDNTLQYWDGARRWGASVIDLTYALESEKDVTVAAPLVQPETGIGLNTRAVVSAHPAAVMLGLAEKRLSSVAPLRALTATVLQPASEDGRAAMDELHQQTVNLLSFTNVPKDHFDAQVAFNLLTGFGEEAKTPLSTTADRIMLHYGKLGITTPLAMQLAQAPVFHGYSISLLVEFAQPVASNALETALTVEGMDVFLDDNNPPSNLSSAGQSDIFVRISDKGTGVQDGTRFWLWMAADNLKLAARNAIACAAEMKKLRPQGSVQ